MSEQHAVQQLAFELQSGKVNRRDLFKRAAALGISATVLGSVMATDALPALAHRIMLRPELWIQRVDPEDVVRDCLDGCPVPPARVPD